MSGSNLLRVSRVLHLYFGVFIAPALLFFALTGALQSFGLHETNRDHPDYKPAHWIVVLGQIHKKQTYVVPVRKTPPAAASAGATAGQDHGGKREDHAAGAPISSPGAPTAPERRPSPLPLRVFFLIVCVGLFNATLTGVYMAYKYRRSPVAISLTLLAGVVLPLLLLLV